MSLLNDLRENEIGYCSSHIVYFVEEYGHIEDRNAPEIVVPFKLWDEQKQALNDMVSHKWTIILKARQLGISWLVLHYACWVLSPHCCFSRKFKRVIVPFLCT